MRYDVLNKLKEKSVKAVAKAGKDDTSKYLPLWMHLCDTAGVMGKLYDERLSAHERKLFTEAIGSSDKAKQIFELVGLMHDFGKASSIFQATILSNIPDYRRFPVQLLKSSSYEHSEKSHHTWLGMLLLMAQGFSENICSVIGAHHGLILNGKELRNQKTAASKIDQPCFGLAKLKDEWNQIWMDLAQEILNVAGFESPENIPQLDVHLLMLLSGILVEADWIASNEEYFPLISVSSDGYVGDYPKRIEEGWQKLSFPKAWKNRSPLKTISDFEKLFGFDPNDMQSEVLKVCNQIQEPGLMIIEAPMGIGKTEAALTAADIYSAKSGCNGVFFGQPTQATANGLFPRFLTWTQKESDSAQLIVKMMHGGAGFNKDYQELPVGTSRINDDGKQHSIFLHEWMQGRKQGILSDFVIGTVDRAFMSVLKHRHLMLRHAGLAGKVVIIDEVHAYDSYMNVYFDRMLLWLGLYRVPVILLSATLPIKRRKEMIQSYLQGVNRDSKLKLESISEATKHSYPAILWTDANQVYSANQIMSISEKEVSIEKAEVQDWSEVGTRISQILKTELVDGGCAGVVVNTVGRAQQVAKDLIEAFPDHEVILVHSRFTASDRALLEKKLIQKVGKKSKPGQRNRVIVVGTQVIEQSLDIDFDFLITELAPIDLLLQRIGRLHRHIREWRPLGLLKPKCTVIVGTNNTLDPSTKRIYEPYIQKKTQEILPERISIPNQIPVLVNEVYKEFCVEGTKTGVKEFEDMVLAEDKSRVKAAAHLLGSSLSKLQRKHGLSGLMDKGDDIDVDDAATNSVRDIDPVISCLLLTTNDIGEIYPVGQTECDKCSVESKPLSSVEEIAAQKISLPASLPFEKGVQEIKAQMRQSKIKALDAFKYELFLMMDKNNQIEVAGYLLEYSKIFGLTARKVADENKK